MATMTRAQRLPRNLPYGEYRIGTNTRCWRSSSLPRCPREIAVSAVIQRILELTLIFISKVFTIVYGLPLSVDRCSQPTAAPRKRVSGRGLLLRVEGDLDGGLNPQITFRPFWALSNHEAARETTPAEMALNSSVRRRSLRICRRGIRA